MHCFSSNCVLNLSPDKPTVIKEAQRVLKVSYNSIVHPHLLWRGRGRELRQYSLSSSKWGLGGQQSYGAEQYDPCQVQWEKFLLHG